MEIEEEEDDRSFWERNKIGIIFAGVVLLGGIALYYLMPKGESRVAAPPTMTVVNIAPPPPPPRPTPVPTPPPPERETPPDPDQQMIEQEPVPEEAAEPANDDPPDEPLGTGIQGDGPPDGFGLGTRGGGSIGGKGGQGGGGSKYGRYAAMVQNRVAEAMRRNPKTRNASMRLEVRIWPDNTGRITRAELAGTTGTAALDQAIREEILTGLRLEDAPPADMPRPIVLRLTAKKQTTL